MTDGLSAESLVEKMDEMKAGSTDCSLLVGSELGLRDG